jgi:myo-inositol-1(or 4)-monophosphatase
MNMICTEIRALIQENLDQILSLRNSRNKKSDESYVTEADLLIQELICGYLAEKHPAYQLVSEEMDNTKFVEDSKACYAVLDPLDGTENFTSGLVEWGVGVSLFRGGVHECSMILLPEMGRSLMTGDSFSLFQSRIHGVSSSLKTEDLGFIESGFEYRMMGCAMYNLYNVIRGSYAVFENVKGVHTWDILPGINLALEHRCHVEVDGEKYDGRFLAPLKKYRVKVRHG